MTELLFSNSDDQGEESNTPLNANTQPWKVLIVDDDEDVHQVTKLVLSSFKFDERPLTFLQAYSGTEALSILEQEEDIALALVDVVMEDDHAGLNLVRNIRHDLKNKQIRLVLRTGQPGQAPEKKVISEYDINDYKNKTELTDTKLHTLMFSALRSYRDIVSLDQHRKGLESVIKSSAEIFEWDKLSTFASAVLSQLITLLGGSQDAVHLRRLSGVAVESSESEFRVRAGVGKYAEVSGKLLTDDLRAEIEHILDEALQKKHNIYKTNEMVAYFGANQTENLLYLKGLYTLTDTERHLIDLFCSNVSIAFDNASLKQEIEDTQSEVINLLGEAVENRSTETGFHVKRVAELSYLIATKLGLGEKRATEIKMASPLHDLGKIAIPDAILHKPGKHTEEETEIMRTHVDIGFDMLKNSRRNVLATAALIAGQHHERWDGTGYPNALKGEDISIEGRISAITDVFDALINKRCYKEAWPPQEVIQLLKDERGKHFDPDIVDVILNNIDEVMAIQNAYQ